MMKKMKIFNLFLALSVAAIVLPSCENWLDIKPKTQVGADDMFQTEDGFRDVLTGAYIQMTADSMYGRQLTFGMVDCIGLVYTAAGSRGYNYLRSHNYTNTYSKRIIDGAWRGTYATLANVNILIDAFENADKSIFEQNNYNCMYGEALALRAYLHFDMLRLYAPSYVAGKDSPAIPYVDKYSFEVTPQSTVTEVAGYILDDLTKAAALLKLSDPLYTGLEPTTFLTAGSRVFHLNYYAVKATQARVYHWINDPANAALCAREVINSGKYAWTSVDNIATTDVRRYRTFLPEQIFTMQVSKIDTYIYDILNVGLYGGTTLNLLVNRSAWRTAVFPHYTDWRLLYFWSDDKPSTSTGEKFNTKLWQIDGMDQGIATRMPLIRLPEMYLILAQCAPAEAVDIINTIRANRGIAAKFSPTATQEQIDAEINMEYLREFICEGVTFYHYKRTDADTMLSATGTASTVNKERYILPMPDEEIEFGNRE